MSKFERTYLMNDTKGEIPILTPICVGVFFWGGGGKFCAPLKSNLGIIEMS